MTTKPDNKSGELEFTIENYSAEKLVIAVDRKGKKYFLGQDIYIDSESEGDYLFVDYTRINQGGDEFLQQARRINRALLEKCRNYKQENEQLKKELDALTEKYNEATQRACNNHNNYLEAKSELDKYKWIPVEQDLPNWDERVLIAHDGWNVVILAQRDDDKWWHIRDDDNDATRTVVLEDDKYEGKVTHWMPLPDPPQEQEKEEK